MILIPGDCFCSSQGCYLLGDLYQTQSLRDNCLPWCHCIGKYDHISEGCRNTNVAMRSSLKARSNQDEQPFSEQNLAEQEGLDFHPSLIPIPHLPASICFAKKGISRQRVLREVEQTLAQRSSEGETPRLPRALISA